MFKIWSPQKISPASMNGKGMDSFDYLHALANNHATTLQIRKLKTELSLV